MSSMNRDILRPEDLSKLTNSPRASKFAHQSIVFAANVFSNFHGFSFGHPRLESEHIFHLLIFRKEHVKPHCVSIMYSHGSPADSKECSLKRRRFAFEEYQQFTASQRHLPDPERSLEALPVRGKCEQVPGYRMSNRPRLFKN